MANPWERGPERGPEQKVTCPDCDGSGRVDDGKGGQKQCGRCAGTGQIAGPAI